MIAVSGADLVGKTTFCRRLVELLQARGLTHVLHHLSRVPESWRTPGSYVERMCVNSVWDRFHLDELAYRQHDDRRTSMTPLRWDLTEAAFRQHCGVQVVLVASPEVIEARYRERGDQMYDIAHVQAVNLSFARMSNESPLTLRDQHYRMGLFSIGSVESSAFVNNCVWSAITPEYIAERYVARLAEFAEVEAA